MGRVGPERAYSRRVWPAMRFCFTCAWFDTLCARRACRYTRPRVYYQTMNALRRETGNGGYLHSGRFACSLGAIFIRTIAAQCLFAGEPAVYNTRSNDTKNDQGGEQQERPMQQASAKCPKHAEQQAKEFHSSDKQGIRGACSSIRLVQEIALKALGQLRLRPRTALLDSIQQMYPILRLRIKVATIGHIRAEIKGA
jgi:hypothetical protein